MIHRVFNNHEDFEKALQDLEVKETIENEEVEDDY